MLQSDLTLKKNWSQPLFLLALSASHAFAANAAPADVPVSYPSAAEMASHAAPLGWVETPGSIESCRGYYQEPVLLQPGQSLPSMQDAPMNLTADQSDLRQTGESLFQGNVFVKEPGRSVASQRLYLVRDETGAMAQARFEGDVGLREPGLLVLGDVAHLHLQEKTGDINHAWYRMALAQKLEAVGWKPLPNGQNRVTGLMARGYSESFIQEKKGHFLLKQTTYSTCAPNQNTWHMRAKTIHLNHDTGRGVARHAVLSVYQVPVFYTPYFSFPIDKRRQSGFLWPTYGSSNRSGFIFSAPYYWNIAPNYDALIQPEYYSKRGAQLNWNFRYLTRESAGGFQFSFLPNDRAFAHFRQTAPTDYPGNPALSSLENQSLDRGYFSWQDNREWSDRWSTHVDYSVVTDDYYPEDFSGVHPVATNQLLQRGTATYNADNWSFQATVQNYQTLHPVNQTGVANQYATLPQLDWDGSWLVGDHVNYLWNSQAVYFHRGLAPGEVFGSSSGKPTNGSRINLQPGISLPYNFPQGYITPTFQVQSTHYDLTNPLVGGYPGTIDRSLPIVNVDSGLYFFREMNFGEKSYRQTLEPRLYYLYVPYRDQHSIPIFDSGSQPFTFDQLFRTNRFTGLDRIGDANQISLGVTTRFFSNETGEEKFRAGIGRIYYGHDRRVMLCGTQDCVDPSYIVGATSPTEKASPLASVLEYHFNPAWNASANLTWDPKTHSTNNAGLNVQYLPAPNHVVNLGYSYVQYGDTLPGTNLGDPRNNLNQITFSFGWPLVQSWQVLGNWNYNLSHRNVQTFLYGLQYDTCCVAVRLLAGRTYVGLNGNNSPMYDKQVYLQFQLKGLGTAGSSNASGALSTFIPGYQDTF